MSTDRLASGSGDSYRKEGIMVANLGLRDYAEVWDLQRRLQAGIISRKREGEDFDEHILFVEHPATITLGRHADRDNVLFSRDLLKKRGVGLFEIERGGDVTFHGPGQLVVYPILDLERHRLGVRRYVELLEESVIRTLADFGLKGERVEGATGVWLGVGTAAERKICAIGVKCSRFVTMHGLAVNVSTDMEGFSLINPCGFIDKGVTSFVLELGDSAPSLDQIRSRLEHHLLDLLRARS